ncbi:unnamed protein product [Chironomus riparius]|uniref:Ionotropic receptor n=1 Tax=Chironomus riparius TaxID=315576 RepID=A0A9N9S8W3_9DIPT|nr:unnamed protein product [Chironomus riparius]
MIINKVLVTFLSITSTFSMNHLLYPTSNDSRVISAAVAEIIEKFFIEKSIQFGILVFGDTTHHLNDVIQEFVSLINARQHLTNLKYIEENQLITIDTPLIVFMRNKESLKSFMRVSQLNPEIQTDIKILIYLDETIPMLPSHPQFTYDTAVLADHFYYILNEKKVVVFVTIEYFTERGCNVPTETLINVLHKGYKAWKFQLTDYDKFQNFHGCDLVLDGTFGVNFNFKNRNQDIINCLVNYDFLCLHTMYLISIQEEPQGLNVDLFKMMSKSANFTPSFAARLPEAVRKIHNFKEKYPIVKFATSTFTRIVGFHTTFLYDLNTIMAATPNEFYTNYEKLWLPFDYSTWFILFLTFTLVFLFIFASKFIASYVRHSIIGQEVLTPALNVLQIFFGISQMKLPNASIPRFVLMLFIVFCLIFRTCYQSMLFEFMTSDMRKPPPRTIDDLIERDYKILFSIHDSIIDMREVIPKDEHWKNIRIINHGAELYAQFCSSYDNYSSKQAFFLFEEQYSTFTSLCHGAALKLKNFEGNNVLIAMYTTYRSFVYRHLSNVLEKIIPAGIPEYLLNYYKLFLFKKYERLLDKSPKVLTVDDLGFGFVLWLCACGISMIGFLLELSAFKMRRTINNCCGIFIVFWVLKIRVRNNVM